MTLDLRKQLNDLDLDERRYLVVHDSGFETVVDLCDVSAITALGYADAARVHFNGGYMVSSELPVPVLIQRWMIARRAG